MDDYFHSSHFEYQEPDQSYYSLNTIEEEDETCEAEKISMEEKNSASGTLSINLFNSQAVGLDSWVQSALKSILRGKPIFESAAWFFVIILKSIFEIKNHENLLLIIVKMWNWSCTKISNIAPYY